ncbi:MAG: serine--tRNA ligase [Alphaproteobacteria bacterium]|nr:serine--tRNA ligase [Alphaproteobacteria bacterium]
MHDIKFIRENPAAFDAGLARRGLPSQSERILAVDTARRKAQTAAQELQAKRNALSQQVGAVKKTGGDASALMAEVAGLKDQMAAAETEGQGQEEALTAMLATIPNLPAADVPDGRDEHDNKELKRVGEPPRQNSAKQHFELGEALGLMEFERAAKLSGARFTILRGALARLERALGNFMLDVHTQEYGYEEVSPPLMVREEMMYGTAQLPKFRDDQFGIEGRDLWLIPTAEVPLTNYVNSEIVASENLPLRFTARTPCFRAEAGAAGKDTRGMIRQHQFYKVEMVSITTPEQSEAEHERMTRCAETVLEKLGLHYRRIVLCTGDMGFAARKTFDLEVWLPGQNAYREISSCSNCGDFQARRMNARCRPAGEKTTQFVHTLNGSGVAVGRCLVAVMENYQNSDGSVTVPEVLRPYMNGMDIIK